MHVRLMLSIEKAFRARLFSSEVASLKSVGSLIHHSIQGRVLSRA